MCCSIDPRCSGVVQDVELCDGLDNDCDSEVDEDFELGLACPEVPNSPCVAGLWECDSAQQGRICSTHPGGDDDRSAAEVCDGVDQDCDGVVDEADAGGAYSLLQECYTGDPDSRGRGECHDGTQRCQQAGGWGDCDGEQLPSEEVCDGRDNDCDGLVDEDEDESPLTRACYDGDDATLGQGICHGGTQQCEQGGRWGTCTGQQLPEAELCNDTDDDCDGLKDEADDDSPLTRACYDGPEDTEDVGLCHGGEQTCGQGGDWGDCVGQQLPVAEDCNGQDDDCDRAVDEDELGLALARACYDGSAETRGVGACSDGLQRCGGGEWGECLGDRLPGVESCNNSDDDCDRAVDEAEGGEPLERACYDGSDRTRGVGECHDGAQQCHAGEWGVCNGDQLPVVEQCNGLDDDCDGQNDIDDLERPLSRPCYDGSDETRGVGGCHDGLQSCTDGDWGACLGDQLPVAESCNGDDDDCDGLSDEDGAGAPLSRTCYDGTPATRGVGECHDGNQQCQAGDWGVCSGDQLPVGESCNGDDDDCDGRTDEALDDSPLSRACYDGTPATRGVGLCRDGLQECNVGVWGTCNGDRLPTAEACNGDDDDCDHAVDEADGGGSLTRYCYTGRAGSAGVGICHGGTQTCSNQSWGSCVGEQTPLEEYVPNQLDDDCDTHVDEHPCGAYSYFSPTGRCYRFVDSEKEWTDARNWCRDTGYQLADIHSAAENAFVNGLTGHSVWIGLNDRDSEDRWAWSTGAAVSYVSWNEGEPNNSGIWGEDCVEMRNGGLWNDEGCGSDRRFVCEWTP